MLCVSTLAPPLRSPPGPGFCGASAGTFTLFKVFAPVDAVSVSVGLSDGVTVGLGDGVGEDDGVTVGDGLGDGVGLGVFVGDGDGLAVGLGDGDGLGNGEGVGLGDGDGLGVLVGVGEGDGVFVGVGDGLVVGTVVGAVVGPVVGPVFEVGVGWNVGSGTTTRLYRKRSLCCPSNCPAYTSQPGPQPVSVTCFAIFNRGVRLSN